MCTAGNDKRNVSAQHLILELERHLFIRETIGLNVDSFPVPNLYKKTYHHRFIK